MNQPYYNQEMFNRYRIIVLETMLIVFIIIALILKFHLIFLLNINWDAFNFLSLVYDYNLGVLKKQFQTFHVHFFNWLPILSGDEISQIIKARCVLFVISLGSCFFTYLISRHFLNRVGALFTVLSYTSFSYILEHGTSFRHDPICAFLFLTSIFLLLRRENSKLMIITSGLAVAVSLMVSIKTVFHLLTIAAIIFFLDEEGKDKVKQVMLFIVVTLAFYLFGYGLHKSLLHSRELAQPKYFLSSVYAKMIIFNDIFPRWAYLKKSFYNDLVIWILFFVGIGFCIRNLIRSKNRYSTNLIVMLTFMIPLFSLLFYRNAFPYFYVSIISPSIIFTGIFAHRLLEGFKINQSHSYLFIITVVSIAVFFNFIVLYKKNSYDQITSQKEVIQLIHKIFPKPVPYIDRCSMVSSFPKIGLFMSTWGMQNYLESNTPIMGELLNNSKPVFLLANSPCLDLSLPREKAVYAGKYSLSENDWKILKENFIHHWGIVYVAGKQFELDLKLRFRAFKIVIPGTYTYEGNIEATINGKLYKDGDIIQLETGNYVISPREFPAKINLRWGDHLFRPSKKPNSTPIFFGF
jgi:hypothetical protein